MSSPKLTPAIASAMAEQRSISHIVLLAPPALVLLGYSWFIVRTYSPYLDWHGQLRSPELAGLPEDIIGYGFWMWWPPMAILFITALVAALSAIERLLYAAVVAAPFLGLFVALSVADYLLCDQLVRELIRPNA